MTNIFKKIHIAWSQKSLRDKIILGSSIIYLGSIAIFSILHQVFFSPDQFYVYAFIFVLITGQTKEFLKDWTPPILLLLAYEYLRGLIPKINPHVHYYLMPRFDKLFFHQIPTVWLQNHLFNINRLHWYDFLSVFLYLLHFIVPMLTAFIFWLIDRKVFREYVLAMIILSYLTFMTYLIFPAAPPWLGAQVGVIPPALHITDIIIAHFFAHVTVPTIYQFFGVNLTAAVPSLHAAYPLLSAIYIGKKNPKTWSILGLYVLGVWFAVVYLGEHYVFDVVLGATYALVVYAFMQRLKNHSNLLQSNQSAKSV